MSNTISRRQLLQVIAALCLAPLLPVQAQTPAPLEVEVWQGQWRDSRRNRDVPVKIYAPTTKGPFPVVVFSHGLGGSRDGYEYLGRFWAQNGFVSVHPQHIGSDDSLWKNKPDVDPLTAIRAGISIQSLLDRPRDASFVVDRLEALNNDASWPLHGRLDLQKLGIGGHSFGANTTLLLSGMKVRALPPLSDARFRAAVALSSPPPFTQDDLDSLFAGVTIPMLHMTGTEDVSAVDRAGMTALERRIPFDHIRAKPSFLLTFAGGDHQVFSGRGRGAVKATDERYQSLIQLATLEFWKATLRGDEKSLRFLKSDFAGKLGDGGVWEQK